MYKLTNQKFPWEREKNLIKPFIWHTLLLVVGGLFVDIETFKAFRKYGHISE